MEDNAENDNTQTQQFTAINRRIFYLARDKEWILLQWIKQKLDILHWVQ